MHELVHYYVNHFVMFTFRFKTVKYLIVFTSYVRYFQLEISKTYN